MQYITLVIPADQYVNMYEFLKEVQEGNRKNTESTKKEIRKLLQSAINVIPVMPETPNGIVLTGTYENINLTIPDKPLEISYFAIDTKIHSHVYKDFISEEII